MVEFCFICFYFIFFRYSFVFIAVGTLLFPRCSQSALRFWWLRGRCISAFVFIAVVFLSCASSQFTCFALIPFST